ncbi:MAG: Eco57I restriction-modification methylase domain-containing protein [Anaerolineales bacterium]|nr:Eco57I restriction-modification methylase domain-containing protein [Anaerolineales bacterium]
MPAPDRIKQLVETFEQNINEYRSHKNETELRRQFLDPFFEALGWDVDNKKGYDERNKEVAHEHSVEIDGQQKKADYAFRTGKDTFDFLVEAKKPSVKVESSLDAAFQIRRYGWSARIPINILTDFEHFAIYDCRTRPNYSKDKAATGRIELFHYKEYVERWDEIAALFSPDAIRKGALDKYKDGIKGKKGTQEVDAAFLEEIEQWRETLARNIATRNKNLNLNEEQVNFAVQMTIDRIIFLRIAEERGMEKDRRLFEISEGAELYPSLLKLFTEADARYNSGLFHFKKDKDRENPDTLSPALEIDDKVLKDIIKDLYYPSPYAFNYIPTEILGSVYERFLGKVIRLTAGGNAKVEEKPEVRKAGGVYYTPAYIVDYIVKNTVGKILENREQKGVTLSNSEESPARKTETLHSAQSDNSLTPVEVSQLKIVDPACGSGSFLLGAYQYLLDWHLNWYVSNSPEKHVKSKVLLTADNKSYILSVEEKKRILLNNIYGVDLDPQAVEVTKLSLLLKVVEDPGQLKMFDEEHILPNLNKNIKNGNALIGHDYFSGQMFGDLDEMKRVKPFDWQDEFPEVFTPLSRSTVTSPQIPKEFGGTKGGGFDVVIGNPPYIRIQTLQETSQVDVEFYKKQYKAASKGNYDIYVVFVEKGLSLLNPKGRLGFILPHKFFNAQYGEPLRGVIANGKHLAEVVHFSDQQVFSGATTYTCLMFLDKTGHDEFDFIKVQDLESWRVQTSEVLETSEVSGKINASLVTASEWNFTVGEGAELFEKLSQMPVKLSDIADRIFQGLVTGADPVFIVKVVRQNQTILRVYSKALEKEIDIELGITRSLLKGAEIGRYDLDKPVNVIIYPYKTNENKATLLSENEIKKQYPLTWEYLLEVRKLLEAREGGKWHVPEWWQFGRNQNIFEMTKNKILTQVLSKQGSFTLDNQAEYCFVGGGNAGGYGILVNLQSGLSEKYILGLLNSQLLDSCLKTLSTPFRGGYFSYARRFIEQLPIRPINFNDATEKSMHDKMVTLVEQMLSLHKSLSAAKDQERELIQRQITSTDRMIDELVYQLYGLSEEEIRIVEGKAS